MGQNGLNENKTATERFGATWAAEFTNFRTMTNYRTTLCLIFSTAALLSVRNWSAEETNAYPRKFVVGKGPGWEEMTKEHFTNVNCEASTWTWTNGLIKCTGQPIGVMRTLKMHKNLELVIEWRHLKAAGNSGVFIWATPKSIAALERGEGRLPEGIEVQILDHGYKTQYEEQSKKKADWFTTNGDVFPTGSAKMKPFPPVSLNGSRSFPTKELSKGVGEWNHYYVRCINGEVRLWVNGEEVSGGTGCEPASGYLCLESEGSPIEFRNFRVRELP